MPVPGAPADETLTALYEHECASLPAGTRWFDAHTHTGFNDPDGLTATAEEIVAGLDRGGHERALVFTLHEPDGYPEANDRVLAEAADSGGRLVPLGRVDPHNGALAEAKRCFENGAAGIKLHPRAEQFVLSEPAVDQVVALAAERRAPVLIHAGRGIPQLGEDALALARRYPDAPIILAHAGISDLGWLTREGADVPNLLYDSSWWNPADLIAMYSLVPPGRILYASDMPYGSARVSALLMLRCARAAGVSEEAIVQIAGGQLARIVEGEAPADLGPPRGMRSVARPPGADRAASHLAAAIIVAFGGVDPSEPLALARLGCVHAPGDPDAVILDQIAALIDAGLEIRAQYPDAPRAVVLPLAAALLVASTPTVPVPGAG
jgi:predicted TIM-barrel fold metal-dependent hydrolase